jgi:type IV pilus assembly protein PilB
MQLALEVNGIEVDEFFEGRGCKRCRNTGYAGPIAIHELLVLDDELREIVATNPNRQSIREHAQSMGMVPLRYDGLQKVKEGITTVEEVFRVTDDGWIPSRVAENIPELIV